MIKFFRKIRQNLLMENKTGKYFKYAIGEIILVVIGILIAIQINTTIKNSEIKKNNIIYLTKIMEELNLNKKRLEYIAFSNDGFMEFPSLETVVKNCDSILKLSSIGFKKSDIDFLLNTPLSAGGTQLNLFDTTYEELLNTGKLYTLGSDNIILAIKNYYKFYEREIEYNRNMANYALEGFNNLETNYLKLQIDYTDDSANFNWTDYPWYFDTRSEKYAQMQMGIRRLRVGQNHDLIKCKLLIEDSNKLIVILEKELNE